MQEFMDAIAAAFGSYDNRDDDTAPGLNAVAAEFGIRQEHAAAGTGDNLPSPFLGITAIYCFVYFINNYILCFLTHFNVLVLNSF